MMQKAMTHCWNGESKKDHLWMVLFCQWVNPWVNPPFGSLVGSLFTGSSDVFFQPDLSCQRSSLAAVFDAEFFEDAVDVVFDGVFRQV